MTRVLHSDDYAEIIAEDAARILVFRRKNKRIEGKAALEKFFADVASSTGLPDRSGWRLLLDLREGPSRNDDDYETTFKRYRGTVFAGFERRAALVKTAMGELQVRRLARDAQDDGQQVFDDETEARAWLLGGKRRSDRP